MSTRDRLLDAAAAEFAARGFDGATVDRIAAKARVNKAMLYYHFKSKAALYREILRTLFGDTATAVAAAHIASAPPAQQLRTYVETIARGTIAQPHFPAIWLRELAEGGRHLDASVITEMKRVVGTLAAILESGEQQGAFRPAHPFLTQFSLVGPMLLWAASTPVRERFAHQVPASGFASVSPEAVVEHVYSMTLSALTVQ